MLHDKGLGFLCQASVKQNEIDEFLIKRRGFIDGVVITGGEPTLQQGLEAFIRHVKKMGYLVKLDTNGLRPDVLTRVLPHIDYIAMDIKTPPGEISRVVSFDVDEDLIWRSAELIMKEAADYEFRTTLMPLLSTDDISRIAQRIKGAKKYALQQYRKTGLVGAMPAPLGTDAIGQAADAAGEFIENVIVRGI